MLNVLSLFNLAGGIVSSCTQDGDELFVLLQEDEDDQTAQVHCPPWAAHHDTAHKQPRCAQASCKGTSKFLLSQGASPAECLLDGTSIGFALEGHSSTFNITARDTYANFSRNGGEAFEICLEEVRAKLFCVTLSLWSRHSRMPASVLPHTVGGCHEHDPEQRYSSHHWCARGSASNVQHQCKRPW
eukprot:scaffold100728_cov35-Tisochrysis_lutea.AAC.6